MFSLFSSGKQLYVVVSIFQQFDFINESYLGVENPWGDRDPLYSKDGDRLFMVSVRDFYIGHVRVFDFDGRARMWFNSMRDKTNVWAYWRLGFPLGPFADDHMYKEADHTTPVVALFEVNEKGQEKAARSAFEKFRASPESAIEYYHASAGA
jgi:hypothetical protein